MAVNVAYSVRRLMYRYLKLQRSRKPTSIYFEEGNVIMFRRNVQNIKKRKAALKRIKLVPIQAVGSL